MATARRMPQNIDTLDALTDKLVQNGNTTEIDGNIEIDGDLKVNGQIIGGGGGGGGGGAGIDTLINTDLTYGDVTVDYNTTDGMTITGTMRQTYEGGNHDSTMDLEIPIIPGKGIVIDKPADKQQVEVKVDINDAVKYNNNTNSIAIGNNTKGLGMSLGTGSSTQGDSNSIAIGVYAISDSAESTSIGVSSKTSSGSIAIGPRAKATGYETIAVGREAQSTNNGSIVVGAYSTSNQKNAIVLGYYADTADTNASGVRFVLADGTGNSNKHNYFKITKDGTDTYHMFLNGTEVPTQTKTLFGDKSIVGSGNIDLYRHNIYITGETADSEVWCSMIVISSKNTVVDSLTDLYTLCNGMGDLLPISGLCKTTTSPQKGPAILCRATASGGVYWIDSNNASRLYNWTSMPTLTITDTVTTI